METIDHIYDFLNNSSKIDEKFQLIETKRHVNQKSLPTRLRENSSKFN